MPSRESSPPGTRPHPRTRTSLPSIIFGRPEPAFSGVSGSRLAMSARASGTMPLAQHAKKTCLSWTGPTGRPQSSMRRRSLSAGLALAFFWHRARTAVHSASGGASPRAPRSVSARRASRATHASCVSSASHARATRPRLGGGGAWAPRGTAPRGSTTTSPPDASVSAIASETAAAAAEEDAREEPTGGGFAVPPRAPSAAAARAECAAARLF
jgi:hypothetical protein